MKLIITYKNGVKEEFTPNSILFQNDSIFLKYLYTHPMKDEEYRDKEISLDFVINFEIKNIE
jgi:hypothetical protein